MIHIVRLIPKFKLGGVESGVLKEIDIVDKLDNVTYHLIVIESSDLYIPKDKNINVLYLDSNWLSIVQNVIRINIYIKNINSDSVFLLSSLWKSHLHSLFLNGFKEKIAFFHSASYSHILDKIISRLTYKTSDGILFDSESTSKLYENNGRIIPYLFRKDYFPNNSHGLNFIFVGRLNKVKGLDSAIDIIYQLKSMGYKVSFDIFGPDEGVVDELIEKVNSLCLSDNITFKGLLENSLVTSALSNYQFYLQTSYREGMATTVIDAIKSGCIPVVTSVGEISNYCKDLESGIILTSRSREGVVSTCTKIVKCLDNEDIRKSIVNNAKRNVEKIGCFEDEYLKWIGSIDDYS